MNWKATKLGIPGFESAGETVKKPALHRCSFRQACVTAAGPTENSEKIASGYPVMPVANGLGGGVVGVDSRQL